MKKVQIRIYDLSYIHLHTNQRVIRGVFEITSPITTELYDTKSYYQLIVSIAKHEELAKKDVFNILKAKKLIMRHKCLSPEVFREQIFHWIVVIFTRFSFATQLSNLACPIKGNSDSLSIITI